MGIADMPSSVRMAGDVHRHDGKELELFDAVVTLMGEEKFCLIFSHARIHVRMADLSVFFLRDIMKGMKCLYGHMLRLFLFNMAIFVRSF
jgi:hypothetical protein